jgi:hypothetical protein
MQCFTGNRIDWTLCCLLFQLGISDFPQSEKREKYRYRRHGGCRGSDCASDVTKVWLINGALEKSDLVCVPYRNGNGISDNVHISFIPRVVYVLQLSAYVSCCQRVKHSVFLFINGYSPRKYQFQPWLSIYDDLCIFPSNYPLLGVSVITCSNNSLLVPILGWHWRYEVAYSSEAFVT